MEPEDLTSVLYDAWVRVRPILERDPVELRRRLQRRKRMELRRPPREWCVALRAGDTRIPSWGCRAVPEPITLDSCAKEDVYLCPEMLKDLCEPVSLEPPGETIHEVAAKLGVTIGCLNAARVKRILRTKHVPGLGGQRGHPVPLLYTDQLLDPQAKMFLRADPIWSWTWLYKLEGIPEECRQTLRRVVALQSQVPKNLYEEYRHPEVDPGSQTKWRDRRVPRAGPDLMAWYKWKGEEYIGYDWREAETNPRIKHNYEMAERRRERDRVRHRKKYALTRKPRATEGSLQFDGWVWICPACGKTCRKIYYPLPRVNVLNDFVTRLPGADVPILPLVKGFACTKCHQVQGFNRSRPGAWDYLIAHLTGGLLYGSEVKRLSGFAPPEVRVPRRRKVEPPHEPSAETRRRQCSEVGAVGGGKSFRHTK